MGQSRLSTPHRGLCAARINDWAGRAWQPPTAWAMLLRTGMGGSSWAATSHTHPPRERVREGRVTDPRADGGSGDERGKQGLVTSSGGLSLSYGRL